MKPMEYQQPKPPRFPRRITDNTLIYLPEILITFTVMVGLWFIWVSHTFK